MPLFNFGFLPAKGVGPKDGRLQPCPENSLACVCSQYRHSEKFLGRNYVQPLSYEGDPGDAMTRILAILMQDSTYHVISNTPTYIHATQTSNLLGLIDDIEFLLSLEEGVIHVRSASRMPVPDLGMNRARVVDIRNRFDDADD